MPWPAAPLNISLSSQHNEKINEKRFETRQQVSRSGCITLAGSFLLRRAGAHHVEKRSIPFAFSDSFVGLDFLDRSVHLLVPADHLYAMHSA